MNFKKGFTLSEVLITMTIIGVVAALSVPILFADWHKTQTVSQLLKTHSTLSQTTYRAISDNGPIVSWSVDGITARDFYNVYLKPYLNIANDDTNNEFKYTALNNTQDSASYGAVFYLADGQKISIKTPSNTAWGIEVGVVVDINGDKKPNRMGRDIFVFNYWMYHPITPEVSGKFIPWGADWSREDIKNSSVSYACNKKKTGDICAALIAKDGWKISKDYPW